MKHKSDFLNYSKIDELNQYEHPTKTGTLYAIIFDAFKNEFDSDIEELAQITNCGELSEAIHKFKSSSTNIGAQQLSMFCQLIEDCCNSKEKEEDCAGCISIKELRLLGEKSIKKIEEYIYKE